MAYNETPMKGTVMKKIIGRTKELYNNHKSAILFGSGMLVGGVAVYYHFDSKVLLNITKEQFGDCGVVRSAVRRCHSQGRTQAVTSQKS